MNRRDLIAFVTCAASLMPLIVRAQQKAVPVIGILGSPDDPAIALNLTAFRQGLREAGFVEGQNVAIRHCKALSRREMDHPSSI